MRSIGVTGRIVLGVLATAAGLVACSSPAPAPTRTATPRASGSASAPPSATAQLVGTTRTVLSPLGLNIHSAPQLGSQNVIGTAAQGATLTVLDYRPDGGGWLKVQGQTVTGWIVADPTLTAQGTFAVFAAEGNAYAALYPDSWTFQQQSFGVVFTPQSGGAQSIVTRTGATTAAFGEPGLTGYTLSFSQPQVVCGYTGTLEEFVRGVNGASASPGFPAEQQKYAEIRLKLDATHALIITYNYSGDDQLGVYMDFLNSVTVPFPLCQGPTSPTPTP